MKKGCWLALLLLTGCGDGKDSGYEVAKPGSDLAVGTQLLGCWQMLNWNNAPQKDIGLDAVWLQFNFDGTWNWAALAAQKPHGGGGDWFVEETSLYVVKGSSTNTTTVLFHGNDVIFDTDPVIKKNGTIPGESRYTRIPVERMLKVIGTENPSS